MFEDDLLTLATKIDPLFINPEKVAEVGVRPVELTNEQVRMLRDVKIEVEVTINGLSVSAAELIDLSPTQLIEFNLPENSAVTLAIGGEAIGKAAFVMVDGKLALEVTEIKRSSCSEMN